MLVAPVIRTAVSQLITSDFVAVHARTAGPFSLVHASASVTGYGFLAPPVLFFYGSKSAPTFIVVAPVTFTTPLLLNAPLSSTKACVVEAGTLTVRSATP